MNPKIWLGLAGCLVLGLVFWAGRLQERSINAPEVAAARAKYDALEGESKSLEKSWSTSRAEVYQLREKLSVSDKRRVDEVRTAKLLGVTPAGAPIIGYDTTTHSDSSREKEKSTAADLTATVQAAADSFLHAINQLAYRPLWHAGILYTPSEPATIAGWTDGAMGLEVGANLWPFQLKIENQKVIPFDLHPTAGLAYNW